MVRFAKVIVLLLPLLLLGGCAGLMQGDGHSGKHWFPRYHTVQEGDTLYSIAWRYGYDFPVVAEWNDIAPPYTIKKGQRIRIVPPAEFDPRGARAGRPSGGDLQARRRSDRGSDSSTSARQAGSRSSAPISSARPSPAEQTRRAVSAGPSNVDWQWPANGDVIRSFPADGTGKRGISISGNGGEPVRTAASGRVVYAGGGLIGYGELIIVKHDHVFLSAYAHNSRLLVSEGDEVEQGETIAEMGDTGADRVMLHFEIRRDGKPVDPIRYLPSR